MSLGEFDIIERYFSRLGRRPDVLLGVGDDAAVLAVAPGDRLVAAVDTIIEGVHFPDDFVAADIGWRSLAVNLSDLAAMGARPAWATLSLSLPTASADWLDGFAAGFAELAAQWDIALVGGDTVRGPLVVTVQVLGHIERDRWLTRSGARPGDLVVVSGTPGDAAAGLAAWPRRDRATAAERSLIDRFTRPIPRIELGRQIRCRASAAMDISDGLLTDLGKLCAASGCAAEIDLDRLPCSAALASSATSSEREKYVLAGGDDYELVFTIGDHEYAELVKAELAVDCTAIGRIRAGRGVICQRNGVAVPAPVGGYDHFGTEPPA